LSEDRTSGEGRTPLMSSVRCVTTPSIVRVVLWMDRCRCFQCPSGRSTWRVGAVFTSEARSQTIATIVAWLGQKITDQSRW